MQVDVQTKKNFLNWLVATVQFPRREIYWMINYLVSHDSVLENLHIIEHADKTPRGLRLSANKAHKEALTLFIENHEFINSEQIFHEIRMNWKKELFIEFDFEGKWHSEKYLRVLEDNPYNSWNDTIHPEIVASIENFLYQKEKELEIEVLYQKIDYALETKNRADFEVLTEKLAEKLGETVR